MKNIKTEQDARSFNAESALCTLARLAEDKANKKPLDRRTARQMISSLQQLNYEQTVQKKLADGVTGDAKVYLGVLELWWKEGTPEQKLLALLSLQSLFDHEKDIELCQDLLDEVEPLLSEEKYKPLKSSFDLIKAVFNHHADNTNEQHIEEVITFLKRDSKTKPIIVNLGGLTLSGNKRNFQLTRCDVSYANLTSCLLDSLIIEGCCFDGAILDGCSYPSTHIKRCTFKEASVRKYKLPPGSADSFVINTPEVITETEKKAYIRDNLLWANNDYNGANLTACDFTTREKEAYRDSYCLHHAELTGATLDYCNLTKCHLPQTLSKISMVEAVLNQTEWLKPTLSNINFTGAKFKGAVFNSGDSENDATRFLHCDLTDVDLSLAEFKHWGGHAFTPRIDLVGCTLTRTILPDTFYQKPTIQRQLINSTKSIPEVIVLINKFQTLKILLSNDIRQMLCEHLFSMLRTQVPYMIREDRCNILLSFLAPDKSEEKGFYNQFKGFLDGGIVAQTPAPKPKEDDPDESKSFELN